MYLANSLNYAFHKIQLYDRRLKLCINNKEKKYWSEIDAKYMTEESDDESGDTILVHKPTWRSKSKIMIKPYQDICKCLFRIKQVH